MLLKMALGSSKKSIEEKVKFRILLSVALIVLGMASIIISIIFEHSIPSDFFRGFYAGTGGGLIGAGVIMLAMNIVLLKNKEKLKKTEIEENDERNKFLWSKASSLSFLITFFSLYGGLLIAGIFNIVVFYTILCLAAAMFFIFLVTFLVVRKIY